MDGRISLSTFLTCSNLLCVFWGLVGYLGCHTTSDLTFFKVACLYELDPIVLYVIKYTDRNPTCLYKVFVGGLMGISSASNGITGQCFNKLIGSCVLVTLGCDDRMFLRLVSLYGVCYESLRLDDYYNCSMSKLN